MARWSKTKKEKSKENREIVKRLDALIRILLEIHLSKNDNFSLTLAVKALKSCGLTPTEIADILGKKRTDITYLLYAKAGKKKKNGRVGDTPEVPNNG